MRTAILVILVLVAAVCICGCTGNAGKKIDDTGTAQMPAVKGTPNATQVAGVSQADLDRLQHELDALAFDEPGGLSGE